LPNKEVARKKKKKEEKYGQCSLQALVNKGGKEKQGQSLIL